MKKSVIQLIIFLLLLTACKADFTDTVSQIKVSKIALPDTEHSYGAAWITKNIVIVIKYLEQEDFDHDYLFNPKSAVLMAELYSYNTDTENWTKIPWAANPSCHIGGIGGQQRLPNGKIGLVFSCLASNTATIHAFDVSMKNGKISLDNEEIPKQIISSEWTYAYSPDMTELIQEDAGGGLTNRLYFIAQGQKLGQKLQQIVPDFVRAKGPAWSPHNREIAFWGVADYYGDKNPTRDYTWQGLLFSPSNLYLSSPEGNNLHLLLSSFSDVGSIAWSPTKNIIAFSGTWKSIEGLWLIDPTTSEVTRIWDKRVGFSWSLDGEKMVISNSDYDSGKFKNASINIIQLP